MNRRFFTICLICAIALAGCAVGPNYRTPQTPTPATWSGTKSQAPTTRASVPTTRPAHVDAWWKSLKDPTLDSLLARAAEANLDLRVATARVRQARAQRGVVAADLWPQVNASASYAYRGGSLNTGPKTQNRQSLGKQLRNTVINSTIQGLTSPTATPLTGTTIANAAGQALTKSVNNSLQSGTTVSRDQNLFQAGFDAAWELDVFGGTRRAVEAADADTQAAVENRRNVLVSVLSEVALNYVNLRGFQRRLEIARQNIQVQQDTVDLTQTRYKAGFTSALDVAQAQAQLAATESQIPVFETSIRQAIYQLSVLLGQPPAYLLAELEKNAPIPTIPIEVPVGLPSDLLRRRPDIRSAERQLAAATANIGVATADLFPRFALTGSIGPQTRDFRHILDSKSMAWSVGPAVTWPVFDAWRIRSNIEVQNALQEQALAGYEQTVLIAFQDVENALVAFTNEQARYRSLTEAVAASQKSADLSEELYSRGLTAFLNVLESQRALYASQDQLIQSQTAVVTDLISLYKALGGGWEPCDLQTMSDH